MQIILLQALYLMVIHICRVVNPSTVRIFYSERMFLQVLLVLIQLDYLQIQVQVEFIVLEQKIGQLYFVKVLEKGSGYTNRKLRVNPTGISTSYDTINFINHGFETKDIVEYNFESGGSIISGLSTSNQYVVKVDDNSFKLTSGLVNFDKKNTSILHRSGVGLQEFFYPEIKVNIEVSYGFSHWII